MGACDFPLEPGSSINQKFEEYINLVSDVLDLCPNSVVLMSSILPNVGVDMAVANRQILEFNSKLRDLGLDPQEPRIRFCDNDRVFYKDGNIATHLMEQDEAGVHVGSQGKIALAESIMACVKSCLGLESSEWGFSPSPNH